VWCGGTGKRRHVLSVHTWSPSNTVSVHDARETPKRFCWVRPYPEVDATVTVNSLTPDLMVEDHNGYVLWFGEKVENRGALDVGRRQRSLVRRHHG